MTARASSSNFERSCNSKLFQSWWSCQLRRLRCGADLAARGAAPFVLMKFNQWRQRLNFTVPSCTKPGLHTDLFFGQLQVSWLVSIVRRCYCTWRSTQVVKLEIAQKKKLCWQSWFCTALRTTGIEHCSRFGITYHCIYMYMHVSMVDGMVGWIDGVLNTRAIGRFCKPYFGTIFGKVRVTFRPVRYLRYSRL